MQGGEPRSGYPAPQLEPGSQTSATVLGGSASTPRTIVTDEDGREYEIVCAWFDRWYIIEAL